MENDKREFPQIHKSVFTSKEKFSDENQFSHLENNLAKNQENLMKQFCTKLKNPILA